MAFIEILTANGLTVEQWEASIFKEYVGQQIWKNFMGTSTDSIIQVKEDLVKKPGDAITLGIRGRVSGGQVTGNSKGIGNEGTLEFYNQRIVIDNVRRLIKFEDIPMSSKRVMFDLLKEGKEALEEEFALDLEDAITDELSVTSSGRVRGRYLYGAADSNWNATHATAEANVDSTNDKLTTDIIDIAKRKALIPVVALTKMRPTKVLNGKNLEQWFAFFGHSYPIRDMVKDDAAWRNAQLNLPPQSNSESPIYTGSSFKGSWNGVLVYEYDRIQLDASAGASSIQVAHNLLLGAQAAAVCWGQRAKFGEEESDLGHDVSYELHEIRGIEKLVFNRSTEEDHGVVHVFTAAVAD
jgi:hypothetical protein